MSNDSPPAPQEKPRGVKAAQRKVSEDALLHALRDELASGARLTAEAIAARAQVNKALLYRWYGGLPGLLGAFASSPDFLPDAAELLKLCPDEVGTFPPKQRLAWSVRAYILALKRRPATVRILLRLPSLDKEQMSAIMQGRAKAIAELKAAFGDDSEGLGYNLDIAFNLLVAGACHLMAAGTQPNSDRFSIEPELIAETAWKIVTR